MLLVCLTGHLAASDPYHSIGGAKVVAGKIGKPKVVTGKPRVAGGSGVAGAPAAVPGPILIREQMVCKVGGRIVWRRNVCGRSGE
jgi:hypothetical protein